MVHKVKRKTTKKKTTKKSKNSNSNKNHNKIDIKLQAGGGGGGGGAGGGGASSFSFPLPYQQTVSQFTPLHTDMEKIPSLLQRVLKLEQGTVSNSGRADHATGVHTGSLYRDSPNGSNIMLFEDPTRKEFNGAVSHTHPLLGKGVETQFTNDSLFNNNDRETQYYDNEARKYVNYRKADNPTLNNDLFRIDELYKDGEEEKEVHFNETTLPYIESSEVFQITVPRKGGRPKGRKNKPKIYAEPVHEGFVFGEEERPVLLRSKSND